MGVDFSFRVSFPLRNKLFYLLHGFLKSQGGTFLFKAWNLLEFGGISSNAHICQAAPSRPGTVHVTVGAEEVLSLPHPVACRSGRTRVLPAGRRVIYPTAKWKPSQKTRMLHCHLEPFLQSCGSFRGLLDTEVKIPQCEICSIFSHNNNSY